MFGWGKKRDSLSFDQWAPIAPSAPGSSGGRFSNILKPSKGGPNVGPTVGRWPESVLLRIAEYLPVADLPAFARVNRGFSRVVRDERGWEGRCRFLRISPESRGAGVDSVNLTPHKKATPVKAKHVNGQGQLARKDSLDDDFGDFSNTADGFEDVDFGDMHLSPRMGSQSQPQLQSDGHGSHSAQRNEANLLDFGDLPLPSNATHNSASKRSHGFFALPAVPVARMSSSAPGPYYLAYKAHHLSLIPLCRHLRTSTSPSSTLALLFPPDHTALPLPLPKQAERLLTLLLFLSPRLQPLRDWGFLRQALLSAADRFDSTCLVAFEMGDSKKDERAMRIAADGSWKVFEVSGGRRDQWECGRVWVEKREVFYETGKWDAGENIQRVTTNAGQNIRQLDFTPMDAFIAHVLETFRQDAETAVRVFPAQAGVVLSFCDRVVTDVIGEYINSLLSSARNVSPHLFLQATPAAFVQAWKMVDVAVAVLSIQHDGSPSSPASLATARTDVEETVFRMFSDHLDEYLDEETDTIKVILEGVCSTWDKHLGEDTSAETGRSRAEGPSFLSSQNPDQMKRNVLAGFKDVLLLPVTIVPRTVSFGVNALVAGSNTAVSGLAMLNPQKWAGNTGARVIKEGNQEVVFDIPKEIEEVKEKQEQEMNEKQSSSNIGSISATATPGTPKPGQTASIKTRQSGEDGFDRLQLLVSLDTALELIQADRDSLKRCETLAKYPGKNGIKVKEAIEEIFILLLKAVGDRHIAPGFRVATSQMMTYTPADHESSTSVAPLLQFFELVHVGDTIQSMVQVYFDKELVSYVDKTDFLNAVMREKKRFEGILDDAVAGGLNAGIEVLMNQVEHIIITKTAPREYCPDEGTPLELGPTEGCREAIKCLEMHCDLLRGSTSKEVLEVFYQEVGIRLQQILQRHLKRQIISLEGGFQIIADLNAYHAFVASLKQQAVTEDFSNLKMLGHVYIVSDAKDLAQIVRDVTRYGGGFRPEDIYEFIQRRADWKKIEKTVDKAMYALSVKDDCTIM